MIETTQPESATDAAPKPKKKRKSTVRQPRVIDPGIASIHADSKAKVKAYREQQASARILRVIVEKRLAQLTPGDRTKLFDAMAAIVTPALPMERELRTPTAASTPAQPA